MVLPRWSAESGVRPQPRESPGQHPGDGPADRADHHAVPEFFGRRAVGLGLGSGLG